MDIAVVKAVTKTIGSLALSYPYLRRLGFAHLIDELTVDRHATMQVKRELKSSAVPVCIPHAS